MYTKCIYTKCIPHFDKLLYTFCMQNRKNCKCQLNFLYKIYTKVCQNLGYILYTNILHTFCIYPFWCTKIVHHKHYVYNLYTKFIQNVYAYNCIYAEWIPHFNIFWLVCCALPCESLQTIKTWNLLANHGRCQSNQWINELYITFNCQ